MRKSHFCVYAVLLTDRRTNKRTNRRISPPRNALACTSCGLGLNEYKNKIVHNNPARNCPYLRQTTHLINDVELLFRLVELERRVRTDEVDFIVKIYFNNVTIATRFESEITPEQHCKKSLSINDKLYANRRRRA